MKIPFLALTMTAFLAFGSLGCAGLGSTFDVLTTPINQIDAQPDVPGLQPAGNSDKTPLQTIVDEGTDVVSSPLDLDSWGTLLKALALVGLGAGGVVAGKKTYNKVSKK